MGKEPSDDLALANELCDGIIRSIASTSIDRFAFRAPIIDRQTNLPYDNPLPSKREAHSDTRERKRPDGETLWKNGQHRGGVKEERQGLNTWSQTEILGWNRFIAGVEKQKAHLDQISKRPDLIRESPLPSIQSHATLWKQILVAHTPITGVRAVMRSTGDRLPRSVRTRPSAIALSKLRIRDDSPAETGTRSSRASAAEDDDGSGADGRRGKTSRGVGKRQARRTQRATEQYGEDDDRTLRVQTSSKAQIEKGKKKQEEVVIDVVARGGAEWIKLYTRKESHLLAEFREQDSYLCSDWSDSGSDSDDGSDQEAPKDGPDSHPRRSGTDGTDERTTGRKQRQRGMTNSIIELAESILAVARAMPVPPGASPPSLTLRFTRMSPKPQSTDPRIAETYEVLRKMGVSLVFGDLSSFSLRELTPHPPHTLENGAIGDDDLEESAELRHTEAVEAPLLPSLRINLDPTALVGLCCDLLHHPLHADIEEARKRYFRPRRYLHDETGSGHGLGSGVATPANGETLDEHGLATESEQRPGDGATSSRAVATEQTEDYLNGYDDHLQSQHSRELFKEAIEEASAPLIEEMRDLLGAAVEAATTAGAQPSIEWYATPTALRHLKEAMGNTKVVGEGREQMRMRRLIGLEEGDFFEGSRYEGKEGVLRGIRVKVLPNRKDQTVVVQERAAADGDATQEQDSNGASAKHVANDTAMPPHSNSLLDRPLDMRSFHLSLANATRLFLSEYNAVLLDPSTLLPGGTHANLPPFLRPDRLPVPKVASLTLPLPIVSLMSMQRGAEEGMTTLSMGNVVFRELWREGRWKVRGWTQGNWELERENQRGRERAKEQSGRSCAEKGAAGSDENGPVAGNSRQRGSKDYDRNEHRYDHRHDDQDGDDGHEADERQEEMDDRQEVLSGIGQRPGRGHAVVWLMPYRSLGEGKRVRFENGDYAFPASLEQEQE